MKPGEMVKSRLNEPYGGTLVRKIVPALSDKEDGNAVLEINPLAEMDLLNITLGVFSPLTGFMREADFRSVCLHSRLSDSGLPWTIPIVFDISDEEKKAVRIGERVLLRSAGSGEIVGFIIPSEIYPHDKELHIRSVFRVESTEHPGVRLVQAMKPYLLAGEAFLFQEAVSAGSLCYPETVRGLLDAMGLTTVAGFHTRNVVHRAHEYLQRVALEIAGGLLIQPIIGWKKAGDFRTEVIHHVYSRFIEAYYPKNRVLLAFLKTPTRYAGPKEAVFHAIIRKNFGCSHFIVGRDHAGVGSFYGTYDAHEIFDTLPPLGIEILRLREPFYCAKCGSIASERSCGHPDSDRLYISGSLVRNCLQNSLHPAREIFRPEVLEELRQFGRDELFYD